MKKYKVCMTIAGSDPSGGAGIQADLKVFSAWKCYGQAVITSLTVQNTQGVVYASSVSPQLVYDQIVAVFTDLKPDVVKIGMIPSVGVMRSIVKAIRQFAPNFVVLDPVMVSTSGKRLMDEEVVDVLRTELMPLCHLVTPNLPEAMLLADKNTENQKELAKVLSDMIGGVAVLVKGGHAEGVPVDVLYADGCWHEFDNEVRVDTHNSHGTGCVLSSSIAAAVAQGAGLPEAVGRAKAFLTKALRKGAVYEAGRGKGPLYLLP